MKKLLVATVLDLLATTAVAENWIHLVDETNTRTGGVGAKWYADTDSVDKNRSRITFKLVTVDCSYKPSCQGKSFKGATMKYCVEVNCQEGLARIIHRSMYYKGQGMTIPETVTISVDIYQR